MFVKIKNMEDNRFFYNQHDIKQWYVKKTYYDITGCKSVIYIGGGKFLYLQFTIL